MKKLSGVELDLATYTIVLQFHGNKEPLIIHFDTPSRRFYFSVIGLIVNEMKKLDAPEFIYIRKLRNTLRRLDKSLSGKHASKQENAVLVKTNMAWRHRLPDLEEASLFKLLDRNRIPPYEKGGKYRYECSEDECDIWANLFSFDENNKWRYKFAVDSTSLSLDDISLTLGNLKDNSAWKAFVNSLGIQPETGNKEKRVAPKWWKKVLLPLVTVLIIGVFGLAIYNFYAPPVPPPPELKLPDKPSIAVLPFVNISDDPRQEYFSDGLTEEVITTLSKVKQLFVIASNSSFTYKGKPVKIQQVGRELGVRYVLEGSVRWSGDRIRIAVQLIDAKTGHHLWAESYDRNLSDILTIQDDLTNEIFSALNVKLTYGEQARLLKKGTDNLDVYLKLLEGIYYLNYTNPENNYKARLIFEDVITREPNYAYAYVLLARVHLLDIYLGKTKSPKESFQKIIELAEKALVIDPYQGFSYALLGTAHTTRKEWKKGIELTRRAIELSPNIAFSYWCHGMSLTFAVRPTEAIPMLQKAIRLNPITPPHYLNLMAVNYRSLGQYDKAIEYLEESIKRYPNYIFLRINLAVCYVLGGRVEDAYAEAEKILQLSPGFSIDKFTQTVPFSNAEEKKKLTEAWRKAFSGHQ